jgi:hypothetical protein
MSTAPQCSYTKQWCRYLILAVNLLQVYTLEDPLSAVLAALSVAAEQLGKALQLPGVMSASASWEPDAVPIVCILTVASSGSLAMPLDGGQSVHPSYLLQPATMECLRYGTSHPRRESLLAEVESHCSSQQDAS